MFYFMYVSLIVLQVIAAVLAAFLVGAWIVYIGMGIYYNWRSK